MRWYCGKLLARIKITPFYRHVLTERDFRPRLNASTPERQPRAWIGVDSALTIGEKSQHGFYKDWLIAHAAQGKLRTWASRLVVGQTAWSGGEIVPQFWVECERSKVRDWRSGHFEIDVAGRFTVQAQSVQFHLQDLKRLYPKAFADHRKALEKKRAARPAQTVTTADTRQAAGGRKLSPSWPQWVAELVTHIHENGIPDGEGASGVDVMLKTVADRLALRGLEGPSRTTSQETMRAVLLRLRGAGN